MSGCEADGCDNPTRERYCTDCGTRRYYRMCGEQGRAARQALRDARKSGASADIIAVLERAADSLSNTGD